MIMKHIDHCKFGDIVLAEIPFVDNLLQTKLRPMLVLEKEQDDFLLIKITTQFKSKKKYDLILEVDADNNLQSPSLLKINKVSVFHKETLV